MIKKFLGDALFDFQLFWFLRTLKVLGVVLTGLWTAGQVFNLVFTKFENPTIFSLKTNLKILPIFKLFVSTAQHWLKPQVESIFRILPKWSWWETWTNLVWFARLLGCPTHFTSGLTNFPLSSSSSIDVKYSQMLTQVIVACTMISSSAAISSSNSPSLLEELKSRCVKINSIHDKWNEP